MSALARPFAAAAVTLLAVSSLVGQDAPSPLEAFAIRQRMDRESPYADIGWQPLGPRFCGGRVESIAVPTDAPYTLYLAPGSGNLFRSRDGGLRWTPIFEHEATFAIGCVEVAPSIAAVVWVGTGEAHLGGYSWDGVGVYRSDDGGDTWQHRGLESVTRIGKVRAHPANADVAWVAAIDGRGADARGVWKTTDAGSTWERVLATEGRVAVIDLVVDARAPDRLFAATWDRGGGAGSGVWRSADGGASWERAGDGESTGLPRGDFIERVAVDLCRARSDTVYALLVDARKPGDGRYGVGGVVFRSDDGGATWRRTHADYLPTYVGWDFCDVKVDPRDPERIYVCGQELVISDDGGATWRRAGETVRRLLPFAREIPNADRRLHLDAHELWIDPERPQRLLLGNDGGLYESLDGGESWLHRNTLPITEFYTVFADDRPHGGAPYRLWGGTQDNAAVVGPPTPIDDDASDPFEHLFLDRWYGGDAFVTLPDPTDTNAVYVEQQNGGMRRRPLDGPVLIGVGDRGIRPTGRDLQFTWNTPLLVSAHAPTTLYCGAQRVFRSPDRGDTWRPISPDLDGGSGGLAALAESPRVAGLLYAGGNGGRIHRIDALADSAADSAPWTRCGDLPGGSVLRVVASCHADDRVFACVRGAPGRLFASDDRGATWTDIGRGLPRELVRVVVEDPRRAGVLYVGTDLGVCVTTDAGATWHSLSTTLPTTPVMDLAIQPRAGHLIAATHGRGLFLVPLPRLAD